jgi:hypothetical protein
MSTTHIEKILSVDGIWDIGIVFQGDNGLWIYDSHFGRLETCGGWVKREAAITGLQTDFEDYCSLHGLYP